ncbi:formate dehydrogenase accessory sulfurtransferase FdhD [Propionibacteriaceae bacterium Y1685]|uniref:formate dehydrogenase accessory sulfurtransferase FdhD n=1 Tax=Microlunatus sp. Y1700 TaxID=3418487 RepID=UPI003B762AEA
MGRVTVRRKLRAIDTSTGESVIRMDSLAGEEPLEIRAGQQVITVTMRTPGHDLELIHGFLNAEGVITGPSDVQAARYCAGSVISNETGQPENTYNVMEVNLVPAAALRVAGAIRNFATTSSCGVCGSASIDDVHAKVGHDIAGNGAVIPAAVVAELPDRLRAQQTTFERTGGLHAAGLYDFDTTELVVREDVGRHNAADKVIGARLLAGSTGERTVLVLSGRISFELVQKAAMAGIPVIAAVSAPSSLAVELAEDLGITVAGFVRGGRMNVYTHDRRIG